ncbi:MAG: PspA/IM30 family protein, partial [Myxococcota bacterium]
MSILDRLNLLVRANLNDPNAGRSDAFRDTMRDMESSLRDARRQLTELRTNERRLVEQIRTQRARADQWEGRALMALKNHEEDLAREAIVVKNQALREVERLREQLDEHRAYMHDMESSLEALEMKLDGARGRARAASERSSSAPRTGAPRGERDWDAEMRRRMQDRDGGGRGEDGSVPKASPEEDFHTGHTFREFDRMGARISEMEADLEAMRELEGD